MLNICMFIILMCWTDISQAGACCGKEKDVDEKKPILIRQKPRINKERKENNFNPKKKKKLSKEIIIKNSQQLQHAGLNVLAPEGYEKKADNESNTMLVYPKICNITFLVNYKESKNENVIFLLKEKGAMPSSEELLKQKLNVVCQDVSKNNSTKISNDFSMCFEKMMDMIIEQKKPVYLARDEKDQSSIILVLETESEEAAALLFETLGVPKEKSKIKVTKKKKKSKKTKKKRHSGNSSGSEN